MESNDALDVCRSNGLDHDAEKTADRASTRRNSDSPAFYLKELKDRVPPEPEQELRWATDIVEARDAIVEMVLDLPPECRAIVEDDSLAPRSGKRWPLEHLEAYLARMAGIESRVSDDLTGRLREIAAQKRRLDRARDALVLANLRFVPHVARRFTGCGLPFMDLVQEGNVGLLRAVDRFEPERGLRFCTYAFWWIRQSITKAIGDKSRLVRLPAQIGASLTRLRGARKELIERHGRKPTLEELAEQLKISGGQLKELLAVTRDARPLEELAGPRGGNTDGDAPSDAATPLDEALDREFRREIVQALAMLSRREEEVLRLRYGLGRDRTHTLREIGVIFGISRERIRQIESEALEKLPLEHLWTLRGPCAGTRAAARSPRRRRPRAMSGRSRGAPRNPANGRLAT